MNKLPSRREVLAGSAAVGAIALLGGEPAAADGKKTFTILHTNDLHSNLIGMAPASDYTHSRSTPTQPEAVSRA
jgi:5'-nucleotidase / UDP-sugar diphosphatase